MTFQAGRPGRRTALVGATLAGLVLTGAALSAAALGSRPDADRPAGSLPVGRRTLLVPSPRGALTLAVWYPAEEPDGPGAAEGCTQGLAGARLAPLPGSARLLLYAPGSDGGREDAAQTASALAAAGFVVAAVGDADADPAWRSAPVRFDFRSDEAYAATLAAAGLKVERQGLMLRSALDGLEGCLAASPWRGRVALGAVGALGFSLGGATAVEAARRDPRIVAVANLDGWLFGRALVDGLDTPYLGLSSAEPVPGPSELGSPDPATRHAADLTYRSASQEMHLARRPGSAALVLPGTRHESLSGVPSRPAGPSWRGTLRAWLAPDPAATGAVMHRLLAGFFGTHLRGEPWRLDREAATTRPLAAGG